MSISGFWPVSHNCTGGIPLAPLDGNFVLFAPCEETHALPQHLPVHREIGRRSPTRLYVGSGHYG